MIALRRAAIAAALALASFLAGCAATSAPPADLDLRLEAARAAFGGGFDYLYVPSKGEVADRAFVTMSRTTGPSELARSLATRMAPAEKSPVRLLVTGQAPGKTLQILLDALSFYEGRALPGLELLYLGEPAHEARARAAVEGIGARFRFAPYRI